MIDDASRQAKTISAKPRQRWLCSGAEKEDFFMTYNYVKALSMAVPCCRP